MILMNKKNSPKISTKKLIKRISKIKIYKKKNMDKFETKFQLKIKRLTHTHTHTHTHTKSTNFQKFKLCEF